MTTSPTCSTSRRCPSRGGRWRLPRALVAVAAFACAQHTLAHADHDHDEPATVLERAIDAQSRHHFGRALVLVDQALVIDPADDAARLHKMALHLIRGEPDAAEHACRALNSVPVLVVATCHARVAHARGESARARLQLERLLGLEQNALLAAGPRSWSLGVAGDLALAQSDIEAAQRWYTRSLALADNAQVRASLVDLLIEQESWAQAREALGTGERSLTLAVQSLIVARAEGQNTSRAERAMARRFDAWIEAGDYEHAREMARFYLDVMNDAETARRLARINASLQHEPEDALLLQRALKRGL